MSSIHLVCRKNYQRMFEILMRYYPFLDQNDSSGRSPLLYCIMNANIKMCQDLLYFGASPWTNFDGIFPKLGVDQRIMELLKLAKKIYITMKLEPKSSQPEFFGRCRELIKDFKIYWLTRKIFFYLEKKKIFVFFVFFFFFVFHLFFFIRRFIRERSWIFL